MIQYLNKTSTPRIIVTGLLLALTSANISCATEVSPQVETVQTEIYQAPAVQTGTAPVESLHTTELYPPQPSVTQPFTPQPFTPQPSATESLFNGTILRGLVDLPRLKKTGPIDGCSTAQKGVIKSGGFLLFTCEKLRYGHPIEEQKAAFEHYHQALLGQGWEKNPIKKDAGKVRKFQLIRSEADGCETHLEMALWADRSLNERGHDRSNRNAFRQIMFMVRFYDEACQRYYPAVEQLVRPNF